MSRRDGDGDAGVTAGRRWRASRLAERTVKASKRTKAWGLARYPHTPDCPKPQELVLRVADRHKCSLLDAHARHKTVSATKHIATKHVATKHVDWQFSTQRPVNS